MITARQFAQRQSRKLIEELRVQIARAAETGEEEAVHRSRVATRRWYAAAEAFNGYFAPGKESELRGVLKRVMKASSAVRDCDVAEKLLVRLEAGPRILSRLAARRAKRAQRLADVLKEVAAAGLESVKLPVAPRPAVSNGDDDNSNGDPLPPKARRVLSAAFKDFLKRGDRAFRERDSVRLHKFRIHAKELRYMLELFVGTGTGFDNWVEPVRQVQSLLGDAHDCEAVREMIAGWPGRKPVSARLKRRRDAKQRQFRRLWQERFARATIPHARAMPTPPASPKPR